MATKIKNPHADRRNDPDPVEEEIYEGDAIPQATQDKLDKITELARDQVKLKRAKDKAEGELDKINDRLIVNQTQLLPAAMADANMESFELKGGYAVKVEKVVRATIPSADAKRTKDPDAPAKHEAGVDYMEKRAPDLVKYTLTAEFPKGTEKLFEKFIRDLNKRKVKIQYTVDRTVHASTLTSWLKKEEAAGRNVDEKKINIHRITIANVIIPE